ncbi:MAG TPA: flagellar basal body rod protein FlgB [Alphaproteobacteria bacterium]|nr:flagellar basal body rod protein FlgB [Alphaproteobacteria bacterium]
MGLVNIPIFAALTDKMRWHQTRQALLAENVANAATPGFRGRDLEAFDFEQQLRAVGGGALATVVTNPGHIVAAGSNADGFKSRTVNGFEVTPTGNAVTLEDEMMKVAANQMDYQTVTALYTRSLRLLKTALGRNG